MSAPPDRLSRRTPRRLWRIPPALLFEPGDLLEGAGVLKEVPGVLGTLLWQIVRDVNLWADTPPEDHAALFRLGAVARRQVLVAAANPDEELRGALDAISRAILAHNGIDQETVVAACQRVARWAENRSLDATSLIFTQSAALAKPDDPLLAHEVARVALKNGERSRGESWLRRAVGLARRCQEWASYSGALTDLATLEVQEGDYDEGRRFYLTAMRASRRAGLREARGIAAYGLLRLALRERRHAEALEYAHVAYRSLRTRHLLFSAVASELARLWIEMGEREKAESLLQEALTKSLQPGPRMRDLALLARARADSRNRIRISEPWANAWHLIQEHPAAAERDRAVADLVISAAVAGSADRFNAALDELSPSARSAGSPLMQDVVRNGGADAPADPPQ